MICVNTYYLNKHLAELDAIDSREEAIEAHIDAMTEPGGEYYPFVADNVSEAIGEMSDADMAQLSDLMRLGKHAELAKMLEEKITDYWRNLAYRHAEEYANSCPHCYGHGCRKCEEP